MFVKASDSQKIQELKMEDGSILRYKVIVAFKCVYCGLLAQAIEIMDNGGTAVIHHQPYCSSFQAMDPLTFITENRKKFQKDIAEGKTAAN